MPKIKIEGNQKLSGTISVSGAKNSVVALIPAAILCDETVTINNVPEITDVDDLENILIHLNAKIKRNPGTVEINSSDIIFTQEWIVLITKKWIIIRLNKSHWKSYWIFIII